MKKIILLLSLFLGLGVYCFAAAGPEWTDPDVNVAMEQYNGIEGTTGLMNYCDAEKSNEFYENLLLRLAGLVKDDLIEQFEGLPQLKFSKVHIDYFDSALSTNKTIFGQKITSVNKRGAFARMLRIAIERVSAKSLVSVPMQEPKKIPQEDVQSSSLEEVIKLYKAKDTDIDSFREKFRKLIKEDTVNFMYQAQLSRIRAGNDNLKDLVNFSPLWKNEEFLGDIVLYAIENADEDVDLAESGVAVSLFDTLGIIPFVQKFLKDPKDDFREYLINICTTREKSGESIVQEIENYPMSWSADEFEQRLKNIKQYEEVEEERRREREARDREYAVRLHNQQKYEVLLSQGFDHLSTMFHNGEPAIHDRNSLIRKMNEIGSYYFRLAPPASISGQYGGSFGGFGHHPPSA